MASNHGYAAIPILGCRGTPLFGLLLRGSRNDSNLIQLFRGSREQLSKLPTRQAASRIQFLDIKTVGVFPKICRRIQGFSGTFFLAGGSQAELIDVS